MAAHAALTSAEFMGSVQGRAKYGVTVSDWCGGVMLMCTLGIC